MMIFANAGFLYLLFLIPIFILLYILYRYLRNKRIEKLGDKELVQALMPSYSSSKSIWRFIFILLAYTFLIIALARPQIGAKLKTQKSKGAEVMIVLDVSNSMLAEDYSPNRLERAKLEISRLVDKLKNDRIGLIIFAGTSFVQLPITSDYISAKMFLNSISTNSIPVQGTAIADAISLASRSFSTDTGKNRAIILITDGENHEGDPVAAAKAAEEKGIKVYTIGVGSAQGQPIKINGELMKDDKGNIVVTKLDENILQSIAAAGDGAYVHAGNVEFGLNPIIKSINKLDKSEYSSTVFEEYDEQFMYFLAFALAFLVIELLIGERKSKRKLF